MDCQHLLISVIALMSGVVFLFTGWTVYCLGEELLTQATEETCLITSRASSNCTYPCWGVMSASRNCTGTALTYTALSRSKCHDKKVYCSEQEELAYQAVFGLTGVRVELKTIEICRCGLNQLSGECWQYLPTFQVGKNYSCTVFDDCNKFDLSSPSENKLTGMLDMSFGLMLLIFAVCPQRCYHAVGVVLDFIARLLIPILLALVTCFVQCIRHWAAWTTSFLLSPTKRYGPKNSESDPLL
eukprot:Sspe_Gene.80113::Locus_50417_Transcript_1_1_Confidence_1.000_Length_787::g.80113::m.80113